MCYKLTCRLTFLVYELCVVHITSLPSTIPVHNREKESFISCVWRFLFSGPSHTSTKIFILDIYQVLTVKCSYCSIISNQESSCVSMPNDVMVCSNFLLKMSLKDCVLYSWGKQGCPLSPIIFEFMHLQYSL